MGGPAHGLPAEPIVVSVSLRLIEEQLTGLLHNRNVTVGIANGNALSYLFLKTCEHATGINYTFG